MISILEHLSLKKVVFSLISCIVIVVLSIFFIDKPLAIWFYTQNLQQHPVFIYLTYIPNLFIYLSTIALIGLLLTLKLHRLNRKFLKVILAVSISSYVSLLFTKFFKFIFGRIGPGYWSTHNFDLNAYGFYLFHGSSGIFQDFPSGHSAVGFAVISVLWLAYPKMRWLGILMGFTIILSLLTTNNHFLGDCVAGAFLGSFFGIFSTYFFGANRYASEERFAAALTLTTE